MTSTKRLALALYLATCFSSFSNAQEISTTGELITNTQTAWQGCSTATSGAFWGGNSGGPCPGIDSSGQIIFSYGEYTLSQTTSLATGLANSGSGLQINGYNYSWWVKNSNINGTQPGGYDTTAYIGVTLYNRDGTVAESDLYNYGYYLPGWTSFSGVRNYTSPYSLSQVDNITLSVTSRDDGYWAGYYGPEFSNFSLTVNYSMDPCTVNIMSSPSCPGYLEYIAGLSSTPTIDTAIVSIDSIPTVPTTAPSEQFSTSTTAESQSFGGSGTSLSTILNILGREQARISNIERSTVESSVEQSVREADKVTEQAETLAGAAVSESISVGILSSQTQIANDRETSQSLGGGLNFLSAISASLSQSDSNLFSGFSAVDILRDELPLTSNELSDTEKVTPTKPMIPNNQLAGDITVASLGAVPEGFQAYSTSMPDSAFYTPREIYKNQNVIDNPVGRRLFSGTDKLYNDMINEQYR